MTTFNMSSKILGSSCSILTFITSISHSFMISFNMSSKFPGCSCCRVLTFITWISHSFMFTLNMSFKNKCSHLSQGYLTQISFTLVALYSHLSHGYTTPSSFLFLVIFDPNSIESSSLRTISPSAHDPDPQDFGSWIRIRKNMRIHGSRSKGENINQKLQKTVLLQNPKSELLKKERL